MVNISKLGFGAMRLPVLEDRSIDMKQLMQMIDVSMENSVTYYDTAYKYHDGLSELALAEALVDRYPRDSFMLADKMSVWALPAGGGAQSMMEMVDDQLRRLHTDYIDNYLIHNIHEESWPVLLKKDMAKFVGELRKSGKVGKIGFSFHGAPPLLHDILDAEQWDFAQIQMNYYDWNGLQKASEQHRILQEAGLDIIVMEPVRGGLLANLPPRAQEILYKAGYAHSPASLALRWAASRPGVICVLSGMSTLEQTEENVMTMKDMQPVNTEEESLVEQVLDKLREVDLIPCTGCAYCVDVCPLKIDIPAAITALNDARSFGSDQGARTFQMWQDDKRRPARCLDCGECALVCPQQLRPFEEMAVYRQWL